MEHGAEVFAARYTPIIEFLLDGGTFEEKDAWNYLQADYTKPWEAYEEPGAAVLKKFCEDYAEEGYQQMPYLGGAAELRAVYSPDPCLVLEYDGNESIADVSEGLV